MATLYPDTCIFNDVMDLIQNKVPEDKLLKPSEIKFKESILHDPWTGMQNSTLQRDTFGLGSSMYFVFPVHRKQFSVFAMPLPYA